MLGAAAAVLEPGEEIQQWVRARHLEDNREGYLILTERRWIIRWIDPERDSASGTWDQIKGWGVSDEAPGAPVLAVATGGETMFATMPVTSADAERRIKGFLTCFAALAPGDCIPLSTKDHGGAYRMTGDARVARPPRSLVGQWRRIVVTIVGLLLAIIGAILALPLVPGPGLLLLLAGFGVLATEYDWAKDAFTWVKVRFKRLIGKRPSQ
jgi:Putative transmembrane protein (PGPGW)